MKIFSLLLVLSLISFEVVRSQTTGRPTSSCSDIGPSNGQICFDKLNSSDTIVQYDDRKPYIKVICYCPDEYHKGGTCTWYKNGESVSDNPTDLVYQYTSYPQSLSVSNKAESSEDGEYKCAIDRDITVYEIFYVHIHVKNNETRLEPDDPVISVTERDNISITCLGNGIPSPVYKWITPNGDKTTSTDGIFQLHDISMTDEGTYTCISENIVGDPPLPPCNSSKSVIIKVGSLADSFITFQPDVQSITMIIGGEVEFTSVSCICAETNPCLWYRNHSLVPKTGSTAIYQFDKHQMTVDLFVTNKADSSQTGEYECALATEDRIQRKLTVNVKEEDEQLEKILAICLLVIICIIFVIGVVALIIFIKRKYKKTKVGSETSSAEIKSEDIWPTNLHDNLELSYGKKEERAVPKDVYGMTFPLPRASASDLRHEELRNTKMNDYST